MHCIYCGTATHREPREHIVPEGLIGHRPLQITRGSSLPDPQRLLVLDHDEVCRRCNNTLGSLDQYLQRQFGFLRTYWNPIGTKSGKVATADRPGMHAQAQPDGPHLTFNTGDSAVVTPDGIQVGPPGTDALAVRVKDLKVDAQIATLTIQQPVRMNKRFMRGLHKIAFELMCFENGPQAVLDSIYDPLRHYILRGRGNREMVLTQSAAVGGWEQPIFGLRHDPSWPGWLCVITLLSTFYIDLTPGNVFFSKAAQTELMANNLLKWSDRDGGRAVGTQL